MCEKHFFFAAVEQNERSQSLVWVSTPQRRKPVLFSVFRSHNCWHHSERYRDVMAGIFGIQSFFWQKSRFQCHRSNGNEIFFSAGFSNTPPKTVQNTFLDNSNFLVKSVFSSYHRVPRVKQRFFVFLFFSCDFGT